MIFVIKIVKLVIWGILHYRVMGDVYVELGVVFRWFWALLHYIQLSGFKSVKCVSVKANSVLRASLTSGFWDIYFKTVTN